MALIGTFMLSGVIGGAFHTEFKLPGTESQAAFDLLQQSSFRDRQVQGQIVFKSDRGVDDPAVQSAMEGLFDEIQQKIPNVTVVSPYSRGGRNARSGGTTRTSPTPRSTSPTARTRRSTADGKKIKELGDQIDVPGLEIDYGGDMFATNPINGVTEAHRSPRRDDHPAARVRLGARDGPADRHRAVRHRHRHRDRAESCAPSSTCPTSPPQAVAMIGLGVGIDYALFIVTRYRENLTAGLDPERSVVHALDTAGRAVLFAGTTVVISLLGLLLMKTSSHARRRRSASSLGVLITMLASVTLLPALLGFVGRNIDKCEIGRHKRAEARDHGSRAGTGGAASSSATRGPPDPRRSSCSSCSRCRCCRCGSASPTPATGPTSDTTRAGLRPRRRGLRRPASTVRCCSRPRRRTARSDLAALSKLTDDAQRRRRASRSPRRRRPNPAGDAAIMQVFPTTDPQDEATADLVDRLRDDVDPSRSSATEVDVKVGGLTAAVDDFADYTRRDACRSSSARCCCCRSCC